MPISVLTAAPYNIAYGSSIYATVQAFNVIGSSGTSAEGNGATILISADAPINLANVPSITSAT